jgi:hypothetical protein
MLICILFQNQNVNEAGTDVRSESEDCFLEPTPKKTRYVLNVMNKTETKYIVQIMQIQQMKYIMRKMISLIISSFKLDHPHLFVNRRRK